MRVLITGATGFAGGHLADALLAHGAHEIYGLSRQGRWPVELQHLTGKVSLIPCNLRDEDQTASMATALAADWIFHLAGFASVGKAESESEAAWADNYTATRNLYEAVHRAGHTTRILYVGSGLVYGNPRGAEIPDESCELRGCNVYAASKCAADRLSEQFHFERGLNIVRARPLNHIGPRQSPEFAVASFARQIAAIEIGLQPPVIETGNLATRRDLTDVRDVVQAYIALMRCGRAGHSYNIGSESLCSIQTVLEKLLSLSHLQVAIRRQERLLRADDPPLLQASAEKLRRETGWQPHFSLDDTLRDTLNYSRERVGQIGTLPKVA